MNVDQGGSVANQVRLQSGKRPIGTAAGLRVGIAPLAQAGKPVHVCRPSSIDRAPVLANLVRTRRHPACGSCTSCLSLGHAGWRVADLLQLWRDSCLDCPLGAGYHPGSRVEFQRHGHGAWRLAVRLYRGLFALRDIARPDRTGQGVVAGGAGDGRLRRLARPCRRASRSGPGGRGIRPGRTDDLDRRAKTDRVAVRGPRARHRHGHLHHRAGAWRRRRHHHAVGQR